MDTGLLRMEGWKILRKTDPHITYTADLLYLYASAAGRTGFPLLFVTASLTPHMLLTVSNKVALRFVVRNNMNWHELYVSSVTASFR